MSLQRVDVFRSERLRLVLPVTLLCAAMSMAARAAQLDIQLTNANSQAPLADAVVELFVAGQQATPLAQPAEMGQRNKTFVPFVLTVPTGSLVEFPNYDQTRHHVYSFSPAKVFDLKLYVGKPEAPVLFDTPGVVVLGCNIHDQMQAYILVSDAPYQQVSNAQGQVHFDQLAAGHYRVQVWHPWEAGGDDQRWTQELDLGVSTHQRLEASIAVTPPPPRKKPMSDLQSKFKRWAK